MALTDKLIAIADAIRDKTGGTESLTLDQMPTDIAGIETGGGGLPSCITALASGTYTPTADVVSVVGIEHGLGVTPNFFFMSVEGQEMLNPSDFNYYITHEFGLAQKFMMSANQLEAFRIYRYSNGSNFTQSAAVGLMGVFANATQFYAYASSTYNLKAGVTYRWVAGVIDGI